MRTGLTVCSAILCTAVLTGGGGGILRAAPPPLDMQERQVLESIGTLIAVDHLRARCATIDRPPLADKMRAWDAAGGAKLRAAIGATRADPKADALYRDMEKRMAAALAPRDAQACVLLAGALASAPPATPSAAVAMGGQAETTPSAGARSGKGIAAFGMLLNYGMGYGGMMIARYDPIVLFADGSILTDMDGLADPAADRRANPAHWSRWRQAGGRYEYLTRGGQWRSIAEDQIWKSPPDASRLAGRFTHVGGGGNLALGGTSAVFAQTSYTFLPGGRLTREGVASASSEAGDTRTVTGSSSGARGGRYTMSGFTIEVRYDDGRRETMVLMTHPRDPNIIWLDGTSYVRAKSK
ncbi:MAG TPA: hypothetical protein VNT42_08335 [Sphingomonas sp.]|nr:hypothetical protein [Sphingomonas sp.]